MPPCSVSTGAAADPNRAWPAWEHDGMEETRVDRWLWAVRLYRTRSLATEACRGGHVKVNGSTAKPATTVGVGDRGEAFSGRQRVLEVVRVIDTRAGAPIAAACVIDHSPTPPPREERSPGLVWAPGRSI